MGAVNLGKKKMNYTVRPGSSLHDFRDAWNTNCADAACDFPRASGARRNEEECDDGQLQRGELRKWCSFHEALIPSPQALVKFAECGGWRLGASPNEGTAPTCTIPHLLALVAALRHKDNIMADDQTSFADSQNFGQNPFSALSSAGLPPGPEDGRGDSNGPAAPKKSRGRVDIIRQKAGRGGKTVTVITNFAGIGLPEKEQLAKRMQKACGTGGTVKEGRIEIQGDKREEVARILADAGFRPVLAGG